jgi:hypothetical protein
MFYNIQKKKIYRSADELRRDFVNLSIPSLASNEQLSTLGVANLNVAPNFDHPPGVTEVNGEYLLFREKPQPPAEMDLEKTFKSVVDSELKKISKEFGFNSEADFLAHSLLKKNGKIAKKFVLFCDIVYSYLGTSLGEEKTLEEFTEEFPEFNV